MITLKRHDRTEIATGDSPRVVAEANRANLRNADLSGADLSGADLSGADLRNADLAGAILCDCYLDGAVISFRGTLKRLRFEDVT